MYPLRGDGWNFSGRRLSQPQGQFVYSYPTKDSWSEFRGDFFSRYVKFSSILYPQCAEDWGSYRVLQLDCPSPSSQNHFHVHLASAAAAYVDYRDCPLYIGNYGRPDVPYLWSPCLESRRCASSFIIKIMMCRLHRPAESFAKFQERTDYSQRWSFAARYWTSIWSTHIEHFIFITMILVGI